MEPLDIVARIEAVQMIADLHRRALAGDDLEAVRAFLAAVGILPAGPGAACRLALPRLAGDPVGGGHATD